MFKRGAIVLVPFPFTDLSSKKLRPAVIVSRTNTKASTVIVVFISSQLPQKITKTNVIIKEKSKDFFSTGLKKSSVIRCDKIATLDKHIILGEIGFLPSSFQSRVDIALQYIFHL